MSGYTGLDYTVLPLMFSHFGVPKRKRASILDDLQTLEVEALNVMNPVSKK